MILDIYRRTVVGWLVAPTEATWRVAAVIRATVRRHGVACDPLTLQAGHGAAMVSPPVAALLTELGVTKSPARPQTSNDNPYSEAQFTTLTYRPDFPDRFPRLAAARRWLRRFFHWYNTEHRHSGLGWLPSAVVHRGDGPAVQRHPAAGLAAAYARHPQVWGRPTPAPGPPGPRGHQSPRGSPVTRVRACLGLICPQGLDTYRSGGPSHEAGGGLRSGARHGPPGRRPCVAPARSSRAPRRTPGVARHALRCPCTAAVTVGVV